MSLGGLATASESTATPKAKMVFPQRERLTRHDADQGRGGPQTHIVPAARGYAFHVKRGERFRIVDLYGEQVVDFAAWVANTHLTEKLSMAYTRFHLSGATPSIGEYLWTNKDKPLLKITDDTVKVHDMTFVSVWGSALCTRLLTCDKMSCFPELYTKLGIENHRSCASNIAEVMKPYGETRDFGAGSWLVLTAAERHEELPRGNGPFQHLPKHAELQSQAAWKQQTG